MPTDRIEKQIVLKGTRERVWRALTDARQFGDWFGVQMKGPFVAGEASLGTIVPTKADADVARLQEPHRGKPFRIVVETVTPMSRFAFRWHPFAVDPDHDYSTEPMTLVSFELSETDGGILLVITESGFDQIPLSRRAGALKANDGGWAHQIRMIEKYLQMEKTV